MQNAGVTRKLAVILAADVAGYSRLMAADEEGTLALLKARRQVIDALIAGHRGRIFGTAGDSLVAEFASPVEAVRCAAAIQQESERNEKTRKVAASYARFQALIGDWGKVSEGGYYSLIRT